MTIYFKALAAISTQLDSLVKHIESLNETVAFLKNEVYHNGAQISRLRQNIAITGNMAVRVNKEMVRNMQHLTKVILEGRVVENGGNGFRQSEGL